MAPVPQMTLTSGCTSIILWTAHCCLLPVSLICQACTHWQETLILPAAHLPRLTAFPFQQICHAFTHCHNITGNRISCCPTQSDCQA